MVNCLLVSLYVLSIFCVSILGNFVSILIRPQIVVHIDVYLCGKVLLFSVFVFFLVLF